MKLEEARATDAKFFTERRRVGLKHEKVGDDYFQGEHES